jgi:hypothetical protein
VRGCDAHDDGRETKETLKERYPSAYLSDMMTNEDTMFKHQASPDDQLEESMEVFRTRVDNAMGKVLSRWNESGKSTLGCMFCTANTHTAQTPSVVCASILTHDLNHKIIQERIGDRSLYAPEGCWNPETGEYSQYTVLGARPYLSVIKVTRHKKSSSTEESSVQFHTKASCSELDIVI